MALGDGIRRNIINVTQQDRVQFRDAIIALRNKFFPGSRTDFPAGHTHILLSKTRFIRRHMYTGHRSSYAAATTMQSFRGHVARARSRPVAALLRLSQDPTPLFNATEMIGATFLASPTFTDPNGAVRGIWRSPKPTSKSTKVSAGSVGMRSGVAKVGQNIGQFALSWCGSQTVKGRFE